MGNHISTARSHFSLGESLLTPSEIIDKAVEVGAKSVTIKDNMRLASMIDLFKYGKKNDVKVNIGVKLKIVDELITGKDEVKKQGFYFINLVVKNEIGYKKLLKLLSVANDDSHFYMTARLTLDDIFGLFNNEDAYFTLGDFYGAVSSQKMNSVLSVCESKGIIPYVELIPVNTPYFHRVVSTSLPFIESGRIKPLTVVPALCDVPENADALDVLKVVTAAGSMKFTDLSARSAYNGFVPVTEEQMSSLCADFSETHLAYEENIYSVLAEGLENAEKINDGCLFEWKEEVPSLPAVYEDPYKELCIRCASGWKDRFSRKMYGHKPDDLEVYKERLKYELSILSKMGFEPYFLLVSDVVNWSKEQNIRVGAGRGSAAGSLVAYLTGITDVDPIRFGLMFERFINPDRIDLPDADLDFMSSRRQEVFKWISERFGEEYVAAVSNYTTMAGAGALKDVSAALNIPDTPAFGKWVATEHGSPVPLDEAIALSPELDKWTSEHPEVLRYARIFENKMRSYGQHAAGIIVAGKPLDELCVVETRDRKGENAKVVAPDKKQAEKFGLVKLDILGLSTLDMLDITLRQIKKNRGVTIDAHDIPLDDEKTLELLGQGNSEGVFQFESTSAKRMLSEMAESSALTFDDLVAANALNRPGPLDAGMAKQYIDRKNGREVVKYEHPIIEEVTKDTFGVICYQEQISKLAMMLCGMSGGEADTLRKAIGKKDHALMGTMKEKFVDGAVKISGLSSSFVEKLWHDIEGFASYSFNLSHSVAYSLLSYIEAYLKTHYPAEFFCGVLTWVKSERYPTIMNDMKRHGIDLLPPDINMSTDTFEVYGENAILAPFPAVSHVSDNTAKHIMAERENGIFKSADDAVARLGGRFYNTRAHDHLMRVGAFARIETNQPAALDSSRTADQIKLMKGLVHNTVIIDRDMLVDKFSVERINDVVNEYKACSACELTGRCHPKPMFKSKAKFMIVIDYPSAKDEANDVMGNGGIWDTINKILAEVGVSSKDVYITSLVKTPKPTGGKFSNQTLNECPKWLEREIAELRPSLIVALGGQTVKYLTGLVASHANAQVVYDEKRQCNILVGGNPNAMFFRPEVAEKLIEVLAKIPDLLPST